MANHRDQLRRQRRGEETFGEDINLDQPQYNNFHAEIPDAGNCPEAGDQEETDFCNIETNAFLHVDILKEVMKSLYTGRGRV